jgi:hypothetical protein
MQRYESRHGVGDRNCVGRAGKATNGRRSAAALCTTAGIVALGFVAGCGRANVTNTGGAPSDAPPAAQAGGSAVSPPPPSQPSLGQQAAPPIDLAANGAAWAAAAALAALFAPSITPGAAGLFPNAGSRSAADLDTAPALPPAAASAAISAPSAAADVDGTIPPELAITVIPQMLVYPPPGSDSTIAAAQQPTPQLPPSTDGVIAATPEVGPTQPPGNAEETPNTSIAALTPPIADTPAALSQPDQARLIPTPRLRPSAINGTGLIQPLDVAVIPNAGVKAVPKGGTPATPSAPKLLSAPAVVVLPPCVAASRAVTPATKQAALPSATSPCPSTPAVGSIARTADANSSVSQDKESERDSPAGTTPTNPCLNPIVILRPSWCPPLIPPAARKQGAAAVGNQQALPATSGQLPNVPVERDSLPQAGQDSLGAAQVDLPVETPPDAPSLPIK